MLMPMDDKPRATWELDKAPDKGLPVFHFAVVGIGYMFISINMMMHEQDIELISLGAKLAGDCFDRSIADTPVKVLPV